MNNEVMELKINEHDDTLREHDKRLDTIEQNSREFKVQIENLCKDIQNLTIVMKWLVGLMGGSLVSFFFYSVQQGIFK